MVHSVKKGLKIEHLTIFRTAIGAIQRYRPGGQPCGIDSESDDAALVKGERGDPQLALSPKAWRPCQGEGEEQGNAPHDLPGSRKATKLRKIV